MLKAEICETTHGKDQPLHATEKKRQNRMCAQTLCWSWPLADNQPKVFPSRLGLDGNRGASSGMTYLSTLATISKA